MSQATSYRPEGLRDLTPSLNLIDATAALAFYKQAFNAVERYAMPDLADSSKIMHGEFQIGDSVVMFADETPEWGALSPQTVGGCPLSLNLYVENCDALYAQAIAAGATSLREPTSYPWGERSAMVLDPFGYRWALCTHEEDLSPEEVAERLKSWQPEG